MQEFRVETLALLRIMPIVSVDEFVGGPHVQ